LQGTYNYVDPGGYFGKIVNDLPGAGEQLISDPASVGEDMLRDIGHVVADIIPHWISQDYQ
jgi:hypothetical protein